MRKFNHLEDGTAIFKLTLLLIFSSLIPGWGIGQVMYDKLPAPQICTQPVVCNLLLADHIDPEEAIKTADRDLKRAGVEAEFHVMGENSRVDPLWQYLLEKRGTVMITLVWDKRLNDERDRKGRYVHPSFLLEAATPPQTDVQQRGQRKFILSGQSYEELMEEFVSTVKRYGKKICPPVIGNAAPKMVKLPERVADEPSVPESEFTTKPKKGWPSDLKSATLLFCKYPFPKDPRYDDQNKLGEKLEQWSENSHNKKIENQAKAMARYTGKYEIIVPEDIEKYRDQPGYYLIQENRRYEEDSKWDDNRGKWRDVTYTYYRYDLKDLTTGTIYRGEYRDAKNYLSLLKKMLKTWQE
ncbi:MAG: hypothetical protein AAGN35_06115 [Bacteroidota bacterium]